MNRRIFAALIALALSVTMLTLLGTAASAATVVHPGNLGGWSVVQGSSPADTHGEFVDGPSSPPLGLGSFHQHVSDGNLYTKIHTSSQDGLLLSAIAVLRYSTFISSNQDGQAPYLILAVDNDNDGTRDDRLFFEPEYQTGTYSGSSVPNQCSGGPYCAALNTWQTWDARSGGWWTDSGGTSGPPLTTLADYVSTHPSARLVSDPIRRSLSIQSGAGSPSWNDFDGNVDNVTMNGTTYDFESLAVTVDCDSVSDDIAAVQGQIDAVPNGFAVRLKGICNFSGAPAHGGDVYSIDNTAVTVSKAVTIESEGTPRSATILGSGVQTAFFIPPGINGVTIRGLNFTNLGRPIYVANASDVTIGGGTTVNDPLGNRILGNSTMDSAILVAAGPKGLGTSITVSSGASGAQTTTSYATPTNPGATLSNIDILGNYISYNPPGPPDGSTRDAIAIDVRHRWGAINNLNISRNAVGYFSTEFPSINMSAIVVNSHRGSASEYEITNVTISGNNLGRLEELESTAADAAADFQAAGRAGIRLGRVSNFSISGNGLRTRVSPTAVPNPGGGIIVSDSSNGDISNNGIIELADPSTADYDLGAIGVLDDGPKLFGGTLDSLPANNVRVTSNLIGSTGNDPGLGAGRAIVLNGATHATVTGNQVNFSSGPAVSIGIEAKGPGSLDNPGLTSLQKAVTQAVVCDNVLDGTSDNPAEVAFGLGSANAFPGGTSTNFGCNPTLSLSSSTLNSSNTVVASGVGWASRPLTVTVSQGASSVVRNLTSSTNGSYATGFVASDLSSLGQGTLTVTARTSDVPTDAFRTVATSLFKDTIAPGAPTIANPAPSASLTASGVSVAGTAEAGSTVRIFRQGTDALLGQGQATGGNYSIFIAFNDGSHTIYARATDAAGNTGGPSGLLTFSVSADLTLSAPTTYTNQASSATVGNIPAGTDHVDLTLTKPGGGTYVFPAATPSGSTVSFTIPAAQLTTPGSYTLNAVAKDNSDVILKVGQAVFSVLPSTPPPTPTSVKAEPLFTSNRRGQITVSWSQGGLEVPTKYKVYRRVDAGSQTSLGEVGGFTRDFNDFSCPLLATCEYRISASNTTGEGSQSAPASALGWKFA